MTGSMVHASRVTVAKAGSNDGVHRLEDIEVKEVSLVDRPANKRAFLVVKRSDQMTTQIQPDGKGGFTANGTSKAGPPPMPPGAGGAAPEGGPPGKKKPAKMGKLDVPPGFKEMMGPMLVKASEKLKELADAVNGSTPAEIGDDGEMPAVPGEFTDAMGTIMGTLEKLSGMWPSGGPSVDEAEGEGMGDEPPMPSEMQMRAALDNVGKVLGHPKVEKAAIAKIGAKMAKERFSRLQQAAQTLTSLINELAPMQAPAAPGALGKGAKDEEEKSESEKALLKSIEGMLAPLVEGLKQVGVTVTKQRTEIETIKKSRGAPSAVTNVEQPVKKSEGDGFSWPLDLNNPVTKDTVEKTESFFGED